jgi:hypothetical protein
LAVVGGTHDDGAVDVAFDKGHDHFLPHARDKKAPPQLAPAQACATRTQVPAVASPGALLASALGWFRWWLGAWISLRHERCASLQFVHFEK